MGLHHSPHWTRVREKFKSQRIQDQEWKCANCGLDGRYFRLEVDHKSSCTQRRFTLIRRQTCNPYAPGAISAKLGASASNRIRNVTEWIALMGF